MREVEGANMRAVPPGQSQNSSQEETGDESIMRLSCCLTLQAVDEVWI